ncbi:helix-turn-helix domain-containing protein [Bifidobacterium biavatii]|uniref:Phage replication protein n=1 Tax=Bifidobacterium biavatii DSM 23969 TaxID=1437608 RepID=A0A086ZU42_9BIFI|nr:helix-turn-helix domain-containing protein [Bifidobacterium biavatii]KFI50042.1 phage replication protein [Bifidobacterium biavatii DSM 23969]
MSALLTGRAMRTKVGDRGAKQVLEHLCNYADENDRAWPSVSTLADECECSTSTVIRALRYLEKHGLLERDEEYGTRYGADRSPYVYHITLAQAEQVEYTRRRAKAKQAERAKKRGVTHDTPHPDDGVSSATPRGVAPTTPRGVSKTDDGVAPVTPRGVAPVTKRGGTHDTQTYIEQSLRTSKERVRAQTTDTTTTRLQALAAFTPTSSHRKLAADYHVDCDWELTKFLGKIAETGKPPANPDAAFTNWLHRARELNLTTPPALAGQSGSQSDFERRARKLLTSSRLVKRRYPDEATRLQWVPQVARMISEGVESGEIVNRLTYGTADELAAKGIIVDDLATIA